ncbi:hypothetical protein Tco_0467289, partial [Tanacetum coccineum]
RYTSYHSSSDNFTSHSLPDSPLDSSSDSSSNYSLSDHSPEDIGAVVLADVGAANEVGVGVEIDEGVGLDVEPSREDFPNLVSVDESLEVMQLGLDVAMQQLYYHIREIPVDRILSIKTGQRQLEADSVIAS